MAGVGLVAALVAAVGCSSEPPMAPDPEVLAIRQAALDELAAQLEVLAEAGVDAAGELLGHEDARVRARAARKLGELGESASAYVPKLIRLLRKDESATRIEAAVALGAIGDKRAIDPLVEQLMDEKRKLRLWSFKALRKLGDAAVERMVLHLGNDSPLSDLTYEDEAGKKMNIRQELRPRIASFKKRAVPFLVAALTSGDLRRKTNSITTLGLIGRDAVETLPALLDIAEKDSDAPSRRYAVDSIAEIGDRDPRVVPTLRRISEDRNAKIAGAARRALKVIEEEAEKQQKAEKKTQKAKRLHKAATK